MNIQLNLLNAKVNSEEKVIINTVTFWMYYYSLLNIKNHSLTKSEINFLACFTTNDNVDYVTKQLDMAKSNYYGMLKKLHGKGFLEKTESGYQIHFNVKKLKDFLLKNKSSVTFTFPLEIQYDS